MLGRDKVSYEVPRSHGDEERFFVEGLSFPDAGFSGLVSFHVTLLDDSNEVGVAGQRRRQKGSVLGETGTARGKDPPQPPYPTPSSLEPETKRLLRARGSESARPLDPRPGLCPLCSPPAGFLRVPDLH